MCSTRGRGKAGRTVGRNRPVQLTWQGTYAVQMSTTQHGTAPVIQSPSPPHLPPPSAAPASPPQSGHQAAGTPHGSGQATCLCTGGAEQLTQLEPASRRAVRGPRQVTRCVQVAGTTTTGGGATSHPRGAPSCYKSCGGGGGPAGALQGSNAPPTHPPSIMRAIAREAKSTSGRISSASAAEVSSQSRLVSTRMKRSSNVRRSCEAGWVHVSTSGVDEWLCMWGGRQVGGRRAHGVAVGCCSTGLPLPLFFFWAAAGLLSKSTLAALRTEKGPHLVRPAGHKVEAAVLQHHGPALPGHLHHNVNAYIRTMPSHRVQ